MTDLTLERETLQYIRLPKHQPDPLNKPLARFSVQLGLTLGGSQIVIGTQTQMSLPLLPRPSRSSIQ